MSDVQRIQRTLKNGDNLTLLDVDTLRYIQKPIGKALYKHAEENSKEIIVEEKAKGEIIENSLKENIIKQRKPTGRPRVEKKAHWSDKIKCKVCNQIFIRSHRWNHNQTKVHKAYATMNEKMRKLLIDEEPITKKGE